MNEYQDYQDESFDEENELKKDIENVKKLNTFSINEENTKRKRSSAIGIFLALTGLLSSLVLLVIFFYNYSFNPSFESLINNQAIIVCFVFVLFISLLMMVIGLILISNSRKERVKKGETSILVTTEEEYKYSKKKRDVEFVYLEEPTVINSKKKEVKLVSPLADLEDEEEAMGANLVQVVRNYEFFDLNTKTIMERFLSIANYNDLNFSNKDVVEFISHLGYSHLMMVKDISNESRRKVLKTIQNTFSASTFYIDCKYMNNEGQMVAQKDFVNALDRADKNSDEFVFLMLDNLPSNRIKLVLMDFLPSIYDSNNRHKVRTSYSNDQFQISPNLYFIITLSEDDKGLSSDDRVLRYTSIFSLKDLSYDGEKKSVPLRKIPVSDFRHVIEVAKEEKGLDENIWRKIDGLESFVSKIKRYSIDNDVANNIENHISLTLSAFDDNDDMLDSILADDLLPSIIKMIPKDKVYEENGLLEYIQENFFNEYALPKTDALFKDYKNLIDNPALMEFSHLMGNEIKVEKEEVNVDEYIENNIDVEDKKDSQIEEEKVREELMDDESNVEENSNENQISEESLPQEDALTQEVVEDTITQEAKNDETTNQEEKGNDSEESAGDLFNGLLSEEDKEKKE